MSPLGPLLRLAYRLRHHRWLAWSMARWAGLALLASTGVAAMRTWPSVWQPAALGVLFFGFVAWMACAARQGYVHFRAKPGSEVISRSAPLSPTPEPDEAIPVQATGWFSVGGRTRYLLDVPAKLTKTAFGEWIVMAQVLPARFLLLGEMPPDQTGWWYAFVRPAAVQSLRVGYLYSRARPRTAVQAVYAPEGGRRQALYLAFEEERALQRVWDGLLQDRAETA